MISENSTFARGTWVLAQHFRKSRAARQTSYLYAGQIIGLGVGFALNLVNTRWLGPAGYGLYAATFAASDFVTMFLNFGFLPSGARLLALKQGAPEEQRRMTGALIVVTIGLVIGAALGLWGVSFFAEQLINARIGHLLRWFSLLLALLVLQTLVESACRGTGRIEALSFFNLSSKGVGVAFVGLAIVTGTYSLPVAIGASLAGSLLASVHVLNLLNPRFDKLSASVHELWLDVKHYGFKAYTGDIASSAGARTYSLILAHYGNVTALGYYTLAGLIVTPMTTFSRSLAMTFFSRFAVIRRIASKVWTVNLVWLISCFAGVLLLGSLFVHVMFGAKYSPAAGLLPLVAFAGIFSGLAAPMNKFLAAHGEGVYLRTIALTLSLISVAAAFGLIPRFGALGACYAAVVSALANFLLHLLYYRKTVEALQ